MNGSHLIESFIKPCNFEHYHLSTIHSMKSVLSILLFFSLIPAHAQFSKELEKLTRMMAGSYSSEKQHNQDSTFFDIRLKMVPIWKDRTDARWLYVEQALATKQDKPYRQRIYKVTEPQSGTFESAVYTLNSPLRFVGNLNLVEKLSPDSLQLREGCAVILKKSGRKRFVGATDAKKCPSDMRNAAYATSEVTLTSKSICSWDRGYDRDDRQVWGAEKGGYQFRKIKR